MMNYRIEMVERKEQLLELFNNSAFTIEGLDMECISGFMKWLENNKAYNPKKDKATVYITSGKFMNEVYGLTGQDTYIDDLHIVSVLGIDYNKIMFKKDEVGAKWFDDIVMHNYLREKAKQACWN